MGFTAAEKTERLLSLYHIFLYSEEAEPDFLLRAFGVTGRTLRRDLRLLERAGVLEVRYDRGRRAWVPERTEPDAMPPEDNALQKRYLEKLRRICVLMRALAEMEGEENPAELYRRLFPAASERTRQRDFETLAGLGYELVSRRDNPRKGVVWEVHIPGAYSLRTIPPELR